MKPAARNNKGIALFIVLWILALLSVIAGEFCNAMRTGILMTRNFKEETQAYYIAKAGLNAGIIELIKNQTMPKNIANKDTENEEEAVKWRVNAEIPPVSFGEGAFQVKIENEGGKININRAERNLLALMLNRLDLDDKQKDTILDSILDWRDKDDLHRLNGAESKYYQSLDKPYNAKNNDFDSIEELGLVKGITPEIYIGIKNLITIYPKTKTSEKISEEQKKKGFDYNKININSASLDLLNSLPLLDDSHIQSIYEFRKEKDFETISQLFPVLDQEVYNTISPYLTVRMSPVFTISSKGTISNSKTNRGIKAVLEIDNRHKQKFNIIQWTDRLEY